MRWKFAVAYILKDYAPWRSSKSSSTVPRCYESQRQGWWTGAHTVWTTHCLQLIKLLEYHHAIHNEAQPLNLSKRMHREKQMVCRLRPPLFRFLAPTARYPAKSYRRVISCYWESHRTESGHHRKREEGFRSTCSIFMLYSPLTSVPFDRPTSLLLSYSLRGSNFNIVCVNELNSR